MVYYLENDVIKVTVDSKGCEIKDVYNKKRGAHCMWDGNPDGWKRVAPVLFPLIGRYKEDKCVHNGDEYYMTQHGFARDMEFAIVLSESDRLVMRLSETEETKIKYPFNFNLEIEYVILGNELKVIYRVENTDEEDMYFSIGGHPAFVSPFGDASMAGCSIAFDTDNISYGLLSRDGLLKRETYKLPLINRELIITEDMFDRDALIIENSQAKEVSLKKNGEVFVTVKMDSPVFGLWSCANKNVPFVCIEPWYGRTDAEDFSGELKDREWSNALLPGEIFTCNYTIVYA